MLTAQHQTADKVNHLLVNSSAGCFPEGLVETKPVLKVKWILDGAKNWTYIHQVARNVTSNER